MKNKYASGAHTKMRRFRLILKLFCNGSTATEIAKITGLNRNAVNSWTRKFRERIFALQEQEKLIDAEYVQADETFFGVIDSVAKKHRWTTGYKIAFGLIDELWRVRAEIIEKVSKEQIYPIIIETCKLGTTIYTDAAPVYKGLDGLGFKHLFVNHSEFEFAKTEDGNRVTTNRIEGFWGWLKNRLRPFNGIRYEHLNLHLQESVWRFNHRNENTYELLLRDFRANPL